MAQCVRCENELDEKWDGNLCADCISDMVYRLTDETGCQHHPWWVCGECMWDRLLRWSRSLPPRRLAATECTT